LPSLDSLVDGGFVDLEAMVDGLPESLIVHRRGNTIIAWLNVCPHAGRRLDWAPGKFLVSKQGHLVCAAHGASFETLEGVCVAGPCRGERLRRVVVEVVDGQLSIPADPTEVG